MEAKYYSINEIIEKLKKEGVTIELENISNCVRERMIKPIIYIDSLPAHACEKYGDEPRIVGLCYLEAYLDVGDDIVAVLNNLIRDKSVEIKKYLKKSDLQELKIQSWQYGDNAFVGTPPRLVNPKPFSNEIDFFILVKNHISISNILLSSDSTKVLTDYLRGLDQIVSNKKTKDKEELMPKERTSFLNQLGAIAKLYLTSKKNLNQTSLITEITEQFKKQPLKMRLAHLFNIS